ncbi:MAG: 2-hydroxyacyl-CoA dehydratase family protein [candidate division WOR-3 bacterium]|nr:2-hydroxyacyl-CoA dehydratase family protein [candidate division WOR-3 bacterium]
MELIPRATFEQIRHERVEEIATAREHGTKVVGYFCINAPVELVQAAGAIPVRLMRGGQAAEEAGEKYLRVDACSFCNSCMGNFERDQLYRQIDAVLSVNTCDMMRRLPESIEKHFGIPVYQLYMPRTSEPLPHRVAEFRRQLDGLAGELATLTGSAIGPERLESAIAAFNRLRGMLRQASDTRRMDAPLLSGGTMLDLAVTAWLLGPVKAISLIEEVLRILAARPRREGQRSRLMLGGSILTEDDRWLVDMVEEKADIVTDILCTGTRWFVEEVPSDGEPLDRLARFYFSRPCMHRRPNSAMYEYARGLARDFRVEGLVYKTLLYCDPWSFEARRLQEALGIPMLHLDTDYSTENREQVRTRVEAFLETL